MPALILLSRSGPRRVRRPTGSTLYVVARDLPAADLRRGDRLIVYATGRVTLTRTVTQAQFAAAAGVAEGPRP